MRQRDLIFLTLAASILACGCEEDPVSSGCPEGGCVDETPSECVHCQAGTLECDDDALTICVKTEDGCTEWQLQENCALSNQICDPESRSCAPACLDACSQDEKRCHENAVEVCTLGEQGCTEWKIETPCDTNQHCDAASISCEAGCVDACELESSKCSTDQTQVMRCEMGDAGCTVWNSATNCATSEQICNPDTTTCVDKPKPPACENACEENALRCSSDLTRIKRCEVGENGCTAWQTWIWCDPTQCNSKTLACDPSPETPTCDNECKLDAVQCSTDKTAIERCKKGSDGCNAWVKETSCKDKNMVCDAASTTCKSTGTTPTCKDACTAGEKKCAENGVMTCQKGSDGCTTWVQTETCEDAMQCYEDSKKCEYACGDDCDPFTIVLVPDTQKYTRATASGVVYNQEMQWIADNKASKNIRFVMHLGDVTDTNLHPEFILARDAQGILAKAGIPYTISTGNHEYKNSGDDATKRNISSGSRYKTLFPLYFNDTYIKNGYKDSTWFEGFKYGTNMAGTFKVGHIKFAVFALEYAPRKEALCWVEDLIQTKFKDHFVIITTHAYLDYDSGTTAPNGYVTAIPEYKRAPVGAEGKNIFSELAARHSNVLMVASGHMSDSEHRDVKGYNGNIVHEVLVDYQSEPYTKAKTCASNSICVKSSGGNPDDGGNGWVRLMKIDPKKATNNVTATTVRTINTDSNSCNTMFCSQYYKASPTSTDHQYTTSFDLTKPVTYKYSMNNNIAFISRGAVSLNVDNDNGVTDYVQQNPSTTINRATGAFATTWQRRTADGKNDIYVRGFCAGGCETFDAFVANTTTKGDQRNPDIASDKDGNFVIVWEDDRDGDGKYQIYMRGFDSKGKQRFAETAVNTGSGMTDPAIAMASNGNFVVTWKNASASQAQISMRGFKADGSQLFAQTNVTAATKGTPGAPDIAMASDGSFVVTWEDDASGNYDIMARGYSASGTDTLKAFTVNTNKTNAQRHPAIAMNASGNFMITWEDDADNDKLNIVFARGFKKDGTQLLKDTQISTKGNDAITPTVCMADDNKTVFAWDSHEKYESQFSSGHYFVGDIVYRRVLSSGLTLGTATNVFNTKAGAQETPSVACTSDGKHVISYASDIYIDDRDEHPNRDIMLRGYNQ